MSLVDQYGIVEEFEIGQLLPNFIRWALQIFTANEDHSHCAFNEAG